MKCEDFEFIESSAEKGAPWSAAEREARREHLRLCSRCSALDNAWQRTKGQLRTFAEETGRMQASPRLEIRLREELRKRQRRAHARRAAAVFATLALAGTMVTIGLTRRTAGSAGQRIATAPPVRPQRVLSMRTHAPAGARMVDAGGGFIPVPGALPSDSDGDEGVILRMRMQRGALAALGLPINEERAGEWIQVDVLVGNEGWSPQAVRLRQ